ncbi:MAG: tRNA-binding protein [Chitinophagales bacterium]|nr:tRNA-binding protein [Chitinophagales bacterium]
MKIKPIIPFTVFEQVDMRIGTIIDVKPFPAARNPAYQLWIDFGEEIGIKKSSAQITAYSIETLMGAQIIAVVNFQPKQIAQFMSECLVLGILNAGSIVLIKPASEVANGTSIS